MTGAWWQGFNAGLALGVALGCLVIVGLCRWMDTQLRSLEAQIDALGEQDA